MHVLQQHHKMLNENLVFVLLEVDLSVRYIPQKPSHKLYFNYLVVIGLLTQQPIVTFEGKQPKSMDLSIIFDKGSHVSMHVQVWGSNSTTIQLAHSGIKFH